jgi:tRNA(Ile)-lysidine synthetase-like protein
VSTIEKQLFKENDKVIVAFSGGVDSLALLILLKEVIKKENLVAVYVNHRLRSEQELLKEELLNKKNCSFLEIPLRIVYLEKGEVEKISKQRGNGIEEAARYLRYKHLEKIRVKLNFDYIATAHTSDDQAETLLMRLLQGSSLFALQGIAKQKENIIRPVLHLSKEELIKIVEDNNLKWATDSTNEQTIYLRNKIRNTIVGPISETFPSYREALNKIAQQSQLYVETIQPKIDSLYKKSVTLIEEEVHLDLKELENQDEDIVAQLLYKCWNVLFENSGKRLSSSSIKTLLENREKEGRIDLYNSTVFIKDKTLIWSKQINEGNKGYIAFVDKELTPLIGNICLLKGEGSATDVALDESLINGDLVVRSFRQGDKIELKEGTKKVGELLNSMKIEERDKSLVPLLEDESGLIAVLGQYFGGTNRVAKRFLSDTLARKCSTLYSVVDIEGY